MKENGRRSQHSFIEINLSCKSSLVEATHPKIIIKIYWQREAWSPEDRGYLLWAREVYWINPLWQVLTANQKVDSKNKITLTSRDIKSQMNSNVSNVNTRTTIRFSSVCYYVLIKYSCPPVSDFSWINIV